MKTYELIIEQRQPPCGGKSPVDVKISTVTTDDPLAYVKNIEKDGEPRMETTDQGRNRHPPGMRRQVHQVHLYRGIKKGRQSCRLL